MARKLELRPGEIAEFLTAQGIPVNEGSNTRLEDNHITLIIENLAPGKMATVVELAAQAEPDPEEVTALAEPEIRQPEPVVPLVMEVVSSEPVEQTVFTIQPAEQELVKELGDVIKAPKVELPGLKVLGKIELPEPKKKEQPPVEETINGEQPVVNPVSEKERKKPYRDREDRRNRDNRDNRRRPERSRKNPIALERERQAREEEIKKEQEAKLAKERRTQNYLKKIKPVAPTRSARLIEEPLMDMEEAFAEKSRSNSLWGRFMNWLRRGQ